MRKIAIYVSVLSAIAIISGCAPRGIEGATGVVGGYYTSADCANKPDAIFDAARAADKIVVSRGEHKMYVYKNGSVIKEFQVSLGKNDHLGSKVQLGDKKTPVGSYKILNKRCHSVKYRAMTISYPNASDRARASKLGVNPGNNITIHGQPHWNADGHGDNYTLSNDWTDGCIALTNSDLDWLFGSVSVGTPIIIKP